jgi:hypothetical protein
LEVNQRLQPALADFWLVWGVGGVPAWIFQDIALYYSGSSGAVVTKTYETLGDAILAADLPKTLKSVFFTDRLWECATTMKLDGFRQCPIHQFVQVFQPQVGEHLLLLSWIRANVAVVKLMMIGYQLLSN